METTGYCQKGDACTFAHSAEELQNAEGSCLAEFEEPAPPCAFARPESQRVRASERDQAVPCPGNFQEVKGDVQEPQEVEVEVVEDAPVGLKQEKPADTKLETEAN